MDNLGEYSNHERMVPFEMRGLTGMAGRIAHPQIHFPANVFFKHLYTVYTCSDCSGYRWLQFPSNGSQSTWLDASSQTQARIKHRCTEPQAVLAGSGLGLEELDRAGRIGRIGTYWLWDAMDQP